jgi:hypothetical protein
MSTFTYPVPLGCSEADLDITYSIFGSYRPSTMIDPAEYPEMCVEDIRFKGIDCYWMLDLLQAEIETACWEHHAAFEKDADADHAYECWKDSQLDARLDALL